MQPRGFTLLEMLMVVLVIALASALVSFAIDGNSVQRLQSDARQFANQTAMVMAEATLGGDAWGLQLYRTVDADRSVEEGALAWRWLRHREGEWRLAAPRDVPPKGEFAAAVTAHLTVEGSELFPQALAVDAREEVLTPDIWLAEGDVTPFELSLRPAEEQAEVKVALDPLGRVTLRLGDGQREPSRAQ